jgi:hypothetical protein
MFLEAAFSLASGEVSDEIFNDDSYIVLSVDGVTPQAQLDYPDVEEKIKAIIGDEEEDKLAYSAASSARDMIAKGTSLADVIRNTKAHVTITRMPATMESPSDTGSVESRSDGYFLTVLSSTIQPKVPSYEEVSTEAAAAYAFAKADALARDKAKAAFFSGAVTLEGTETPLFSRSDYLIGGEYMRQFIEQSFQLKTGQTGILKNSGKYYVTLPLDRGVGLSGDTSDNSILRSQVLREKRIEYANEWLKDQRRKAVIKVNI